MYGAGYGTFQLVLRCRCSDNSNGDWRIAVTFGANCVIIFITEIVLVRDGWTLTELFCTPPFGNFYWINIEVKPVLSVRQGNH